jgi:hypothetical protein
MHTAAGIILVMIACIVVSAPIMAHDMNTEASADTRSTEPDFTLTAVASEGKWNVRAVEDSEPQFHEGEFLYIPPPSTSQNPEHPLFHAGTFEFVPAASGQRSGRLVRPISGPILVSYSGSRQLNAEKRANTSGTLATPVTSLPAVVTTPEPAYVETAVPHPQITASPAAEATTELKLLPATDDIENPQFYRGSFVYDPDTKSLTAVPKTYDSSAGTDASPRMSSGDANSVPPSEKKIGPATGTNASTSFPRRGRAMYYNPGIMDLVLSFRLQVGHVSTCFECVGYVALMGREDLNLKVWLEWEDGSVEGPFLVIDVAARKHVPSLLSRNWVVDVDYETALRRGMNRPLPVTVWDTPQNTRKSKSANPDSGILIGDAAHPR